MFEVTVEGTGTRVSIDDAEAVGFYRLLRVTAEDRASAGRRAMEIVRADWETGRRGPHSRINRGRTPDLRVDGIEVLPWWHRFIPLKFTKTEIALENCKRKAAYLPERTQVHRVQHIGKWRKRVKSFIRFFQRLLGNTA